MRKVRLTESKLNNIISESIRRVLKELYEAPEESEFYFSFIRYEDRSWIPIKPFHVVKDGEVNDWKDTITIDGKEYKINNKNTNFGGYVEPGDLMFDVYDEFYFYRRGFGVVYCDFYGGVLGTDADLSYYYETAHSD